MDEGDQLLLLAAQLYENKAIATVESLETSTSRFLSSTKSLVVKFLSFS